MASYTTGKVLYEKMLALQEKASANIAASKQALEPKLNAQGLTLTEGDTYSSIINDLKKMTTVERNIENGNLDEMTFVDNGLFSTSILPSNAVMLSKSRVIFVEEGLLYIMDIDPVTSVTSYKKIYKIDEIWQACNGTTVTLLYDDYNHNIFIYPTYGKKIVVIHGEGIYTTGDINYTTIDLVENTNILGLTYIYMEVAFVTGDNRYHRIYAFDNTVNYTITDDNIDDIPMPFKAVAVCDGNINYIAASDGSVYRYSTVAKKFTYYTDIYNEKDEAQHTINVEAKPELYTPILAFSKNQKRVSIVTKDGIYTTFSDNDLDFENPMTKLELPYTMVSAKMTVNRVDPDSQTYVYGYNSNLDMVAMYFTTENIPVEIIELGNAEAKPQYILFNCCNTAGVMIQVYEVKIKAKDYFDGVTIKEKGYEDYNYTTISMKVGMYEGGNYLFGQEFNPLFIPDKIVCEKETTIVTSSSPSSLMFNIAVTNDHVHWKIHNIPDDIAINVQDIASGENVFVMVGLFSDTILVSNYGYDWRTVNLPKELSLISVTYNAYYKKFYAMNDNGCEFIEYDPVTNNVKFYDMSNSDMSYGAVPTKIVSLDHKIYLVYKSYMADGGRIFESNNNHFDNSALANGFKWKTFNITNEYDKYHGCSILLRDIVEFGDDVFGVYEIDYPWFETAYVPYDKILKTGMIVHHAKNDVELNELSKSISRSNDRVVFPLDPNETVDVTMYLNHLIINHPSNKGYISSTSNLPIIYGEINNGKYYTILANARSGASCEGYIHFIQNHVNTFTRYSYIVTSDSWYDPTVIAADVPHGKSAFIVKEFGLENVNSDVDKNGNISVYPTHFSNIKNETGCSIIHTDKYYMITKGRYLYMSDDGIEWSFRQLPKNGNWHDIAYNGSIYVIVNNIDMLNAEVWYSSNLYDWVKATLPTMHGWSELTWDESRFVLIAGYVSDNAKALVSTDGIHWSDITFNYPVNTFRYEVGEGSFYRGYGFNTLSPNVNIPAIDGDVWSLKTPGFVGAENDPVYAVCGSGMEKTDGSDIADSYVALCSSGLIRFRNIDNNNEFHDSVAYLENKPKNMRMITDEYGRKFFFFYNLNENFLYMAIVNDKYDTTFSVSRIDLPIAITRDCAQLFCYNKGKVIVGTSQPTIIDLTDTYPDIIEGSFNVLSGELHREPLPFTPDHVFLFGAKSYNKDNRFIIGEIHREKEISFDGTAHSSMTFFNNTLETMDYRSDINNQIMENSFVFANNTMNDRHINYIAIKEDHYK